MSDLPEPMTPHDCDLRGYDFMPLFGQRLFGSRLYTKALRNPRAGLAAVKLWWCAWTQCPAASLPDDDDDLAMLADFGTDMKSWSKCREIALQGFVKCSDGRLYHPVLAEEAKVAFEKRLKDRERKAKQRAAKTGQNKDVPDCGRKDIHVNSIGCPMGHDADVRSDRTETGQDSKNNVPSERRAASSEPDGSQSEIGESSGTELTTPKPITQPAAPQSPPSEAAGGALALFAPDNSGAAPATAQRQSSPIPVDARTALFTLGLQALRRMTGRPEKACRAMLGKWLKSAKDDAQVLGTILLQAAETRPADPIAWIEGSIRHRFASHQEQMRQDWNLDDVDLHDAPRREWEEKQRIERERRQALLAGMRP